MQVYLSSKAKTGIFGVLDFMASDRLRFILSQKYGVLLNLEFVLVLSSWLVYKEISWF